MAFDRMATFHVYAGSPVYYNGVAYNTYSTWCEFILSPVLSAGVPGGGYIGQVVIRCPYSPLLTEAFARRSGSTELVNQTWERFVLDGISYTLDTVQVSEGYKFCDATGTDGAPILPN